MHELGSTRLSRYLFKSDHHVCDFSNIIYTMFASVEGSSYSVVGGVTINQSITGQSFDQLINEMIKI